jgi:hypothetical protein
MDRVSDAQSLNAAAQRDDLAGDIGAKDRFWGARDKWKRRTLKETPVPFVD